MVKRCKHGSQAIQFIVFAVHFDCIIIIVLNPAPCVSIDILFFQPFGEHVPFVTKIQTYATKKQSYSVAATKNRPIVLLCHTLLLTNHIIVVKL